MTMTTDLGSLIARERMARGWSTREMQRRGGPAYNTISKIETGKSRPDPNTLWRIATAFADECHSVGAWFARLLRAAGYPVDDAEDAVLARMMSVLSDEQRAALTEMTADDLAAFVSLFRQMRGREPAE